MPGRKGLEGDFPIRRKFRKRLRWRQVSELAASTHLEEIHTVVALSTKNNQQKNTTLLLKRPPKIHLHLRR